MTSMVEKMARAAYESGRKQISVAGIVLPPWDDLTDEMRQAVYPNMIEALKAIREPTEAMKEAGQSHHWGHSMDYTRPEDERANCGDIFTAMIDAAIAEAGK